MIHFATFCFHDPESNRLDVWSTTGVDSFKSWIDAAMFGVIGRSLSDEWFVG